MICFIFPYLSLLNLKGTWMCLNISGMHLLWKRQNERHLGDYHWPSLDVWQAQTQSLTCSDPQTSWYEFMQHKLATASLSGLLCWTGNKGHSHFSFCLPPSAKSSIGNSINGDQAHPSSPDFLWLSTVSGMEDTLFNYLLFKQSNKWLSRQ